MSQLNIQTKMNMLKELFDNTRNTLTPKDNQR